MLRIFTTVKIQRLRPGLNLQTWVPEASMLTTRPPKPSTHSVTSEFNFENSNLLTSYDVTGVSKDEGKTIFRNVGTYYDVTERNVTEDIQSLGASLAQHRMS